MKKSKTIIVILLGVLLSSFIQKNKEAYSLTVKVKDLRSKKGHVQFALYNCDDSIPDENFKKHYKMEIGEINKNASTITFNKLPPGKYAVNILHDENKDGKIDKGWVLPTEGIGFSNITTISPLNKPNFKKASFDLSTDKTIEVKVIYM
jgi:uncharacterized protein (DUF2141 family)